MKDKLSGVDDGGKGPGELVVGSNPVVVKRRSLFTIDYGMCRVSGVCGGILHRRVSPLNCT